MEKRKSKGVWYTNSAAFENNNGPWELSRHPTSRNNVPVELIELPFIEDRRRLKRREDDEQPNDQR